MIANHTKGPWEFSVEGNDHGGWRQATQEVRIWSGATLIAAYDTSFMEYPENDENEANARLIAAAPDLLEALITTRKIIHHYMDAEYIAMDADAKQGLGQYLDAAIARATEQGHE